MALLDVLTVRHDGVLVRPLAEEIQTTSGFYIPEQARETPRRAVVLLVGVGALQDLHPGDLVLYQKYAGIQVDEAENLLLLVDREIFLTVLATDVRLVQHPDPHQWHLVGSSCEVCVAEAQKAAS